MEEKKFGFSSFTLHLLAMGFMLLDHLWATLVSGNEWMTYVGRMAFPMFAFFTAEGFFRSHNRKKYLLRMLLFALLSEIPYDLMVSGSAFFPYQQNVLWTFLIALCAMLVLERLKNASWKRWVLSPLVVLVAFLLGMVGMTDYLGGGVCIVLLFYFFHGRKWFDFAGQFLGLYLIDAVIIRGMDLPLFGGAFFFPTQAFSLFALPLLWLYNGKQGPHNKAIQYGFYAFYPLHMLILSLLALA